MTVHPLAVAGAVWATLVVLQVPVLPPPGAVPAAGALLVVSALIAAHRGKSSAAIALCLCLVPGRALYEASLWQTSLLPEACERRPLRLNGQVRELARSYEQGDGTLWRVTLDVDELLPPRCRGPRRIRVYLKEAVEREPEVHGEPFPPGKTLALEARLRRPWGLVNTVQAVGEREYLRHGIHGVGAAKLSPQQPSVSRENIALKLGRVRLALSTWIRHAMDERAGPLLTALAVGDQRHIGAQTWSQLRNFGLTHLLVISGLHISLAAMPGWCIGALASRLLCLAERHARYPPPVLALAGAGAYALLAGLSLPTQRALLMLTLLCLPRVAGRPVCGARTLAMAVVCLLVLDPLAVLSPSFWLSCGAVALLLWFAGWKKGIRGVRQLVLVQIFLVVAMLPLSLFWFGSGSGPGAALNVIAIPMVSLWTTPLLLAALFTHSLGLPFAVELLELSGLSLRILLGLMTHLQPIVGAPTELDKTPAVGVLLLFMIAVGAWVIPALRGARFASMALALPLLISPLVPRPPRLEVSFLDVGQGTAVLLRSGHRLLLYDTGPGPPDGQPVALRAVLPELRRYPGDRLEMLVISHPDLDHSAGEGMLRERTGVAVLRRGIAAKDSRERCRHGRRERFGHRIHLEYLSSAQPSDDDNNSSCVLLLHAFGYRFLLTGDIDQDRERDLAAYWGEELWADVLLAAHHGSGGSTGRLWLRRVKPAYVIVTAGRANRFGHPAPGVLHRVAAQGAVLLNTATDGALVFSLGPDGELRCRRRRHRGLAFWRRGRGTSDCGTVARRRAGIIPAIRTGEP
ncbi:MAG: DNA internalization-related competence protein ComEC/Rec2 [Pseudomonadota bacterium]